MRIRHVPRAAIAVALPALALALTVAACGSSSTPKPAAKASAGTATTTTTAGGVRSAAFTTCLKQHGVALPGRRGGFRNGRGGLFGGGGAPGAGGTPPYGTGAAPRTGQGGYNGGGFFRRDPKLGQALQACAKDLPAGFRGRFGPGAARGPRRSRFSAATLNSFVACVKRHGYTLPKPNTSGTGPVFPTSIQSNKRFLAAAKSCTGILRPESGPDGQPPAGGTGTSTTSSA